MVFIVLSYSWTSNTVDQKKVAVQVWLQPCVCVFRRTGEHGVC